MKKGRSVISYILLSVVLFMSGVMIDASPGDRVREGMQDLVNTEDVDTDDKAAQDDKQDDTKSDNNVQDVPKRQEALRYYYTLLSDSEKEEYRKIQKAEANEQQSVVLSAMDAEELERIFLCVYNDYPEYFWCESDYQYRSDANEVELIFHYNCTGEERKKKEGIIKKESKAILAGIPKGDKDYDKVKYIFDTLVDMTEYELNSSDNQNIYSVFGNWTSVCAGYARATKYLLDRAGVECIYVTGYAGEDHAWNIVKCEENYYYVDTTWGDPVYQELHEDEVLRKTKGYEYLCASEQLLSRTHTASADFTLPECTDTSLEYYRLQGRYLDHADQKSVVDLMKKDVDANRKQTEIQFSEDALLKQALGEIDGTLQQMAEYIVSSKEGKADGILYEYKEFTGVLIVYWE